MKKIIKISFVEPFTLECEFNNGEVRLLNLEKALDKNKKITNKIFDKKEFKKAQIGEFGQIYWANMAEITNLDGTIESCDYDISPEFAYLHSEKVQELV